MAKTELDWEFEAVHALTMAELGFAVRNLEHYRSLATKHTPPPGKIAVHLTEAQAEALVSILGQEEWPEEHIGPIQEAVYTALEKNQENH